MHPILSISLAIYTKNFPYPLRLEIFVEQINQQVWSKKNKREAINRS
jgi:hypothetical protein